MHVIVCTGDSHTWGQGALGMTDDFIPPVMAGDLRWGNFKSKCYVNLLREGLNKKTNSKALQFGAKDKEMLHLVGDNILNDNITLLNGNLSLVTDASMVRLQFHCGAVNGDAQIYINSVLSETISTYSAAEVNQYKTVVLRLDGKHNTVTISTTDSRVDVYKIELYTGKTAVINSGVGSCTTQRYLTDYWETHIKQYSPKMVLIEGHSINDWLNNIKIEEYIDNLKELFSRTKTIGAIPILLTVSPILGNQLSDSGIEYKEYIKSSKLAAVQSDVKVADANTLIKNIYENLNHKTRDLDMFTDAWHVSNLGHELYYKAIREVIYEI